MMNENGWGIHKYYCAHNGERDSYGEKSEAAKSWARALLTVNPNAKKQVEYAKDKWNSRVRELLRSETGLKFLRAESSESSQPNTVQGNKNSLVSRICGDT